MYIVYFSIFVFVVFCLFMVTDEGSHSPEMASLFIVLFMVVGWFVGALLAFGAQCILVPTKEVALQTVELVAVRTGSGVLDDDAGARAARVYVRNQDGSFSPVQIPADADVRIFEDAALDARGSWTQIAEVTDTNSKWYSWFAVWDTKRVRRHVLRIPVGASVEFFLLQ
ncbi:MAG: hypothetical protein K2Y39_02160 [Candidatus Obscuribacterales bacterium]|nr:hypothetical protein [Candidatus Obscuribacterales bacterium]